MHMTMGRCSSDPGRLGSFPTNNATTTTATTASTTTTNTSESESESIKAITAEGNHRVVEDEEGQETAKSEQDWDNYVERYLSEAYSEEPYDPETTKNLLEFGEDYRIFFDSHSDGGASSRSSTLRLPPRRHRRVSDDSDSEAEEMRHLMLKSEKQRAWLERRLNELLESGVGLADVGQMSATCQENLHCLRVVERGRSQVRTREEDRNFRKLRAEWENVSAKVDQAANLHRLRTDLAGLRQTLITIGNRINSTTADHISSIDHLRATLQELQTAMDALNDRKRDVEEAKCRVAQIDARKGGLAGAVRDEVRDLYVLSEENAQRGAALQADLHLLRDRWTRLEQQKEDLERCLREDRALLLQHLQGGMHGCGGSSTDSGVSDSDLELSEREGRLQMLKESAKDLITAQALPPGSVAANAIEASLNTAEDQLCALKTAVHQAMLLQPRPSFLRHHNKRREEDLEKPNQEKKKKKKKLKRRSEMHSTPQTFLSKSWSGHMTAPGGPPPPPPPPSSSGSSPSRAWRILKIAMAFQALMLGLFYVAYLIQPECCDFSAGAAWGPHLSYIHGVPPF